MSYSLVLEEPVNLLDVLLRPDVAPVSLIRSVLQHRSHILQARADPGALQRFAIQRPAQGSQLVLELAQKRRVARRIVDALSERPEGRVSFVKLSRPTSPSWKLANSILNHWTGVG